MPASHQSRLDAKPPTELLRATQPTVDLTALVFQTRVKQSSVTNSCAEMDLSVREDGRQLAACVGDTAVDMDLEQRTIVHGCLIWSRAVSEKWSLLSLIQSSLAK